VILYSITASDLPTEHSVQKILNQFLINLPNPKFSFFKYCIWIIRSTSIQRCDFDYNI